MADEILENYTNVECDNKKIFEDLKNQDLDDFSKIFQIIK